MNPILNKIDNDIRRKLKEKTSNGKVHRKAKIKINSDDRKYEKYEHKNLLNKKNISERIVIEVIKTVESNIKLDGEKEENIKNIRKGTFLDVKK